MQASSRQVGVEIVVMVGAVALLGYLVAPRMTCDCGIDARRDMAVAMARGGLHGSIEMYKAHVGRYPESLRELYERPDLISITGEWKGPYLRGPDKLVDPWGRACRYQVPGTHNREGFDLWSIGPDGLDGTDDDITNWQ